MALRAQTRGRASAPCCRRRRGAALAGAAASRGKFVPLIREGYKALVAAGKVEDAWVEDKLPKMAKSMEMWAGLMRTDVASIGAVDQMAFNNLMPDKTSKRLVQEAKDFKKLAKSRDYDGAVKAFKTYLDDLATTPGKIDL
ncbi:unnamed protein product [Prorocentrum cordatum]|uniref:Uncharacterized protein n=1 Tax=Prorocentrum cordatum TaxID=2364126 RepID=A0ABN9PM80_9DINO|nr:unnamed protein product [Polarella glacialis]